MMHKPIEADKTKLSSQGSNKLMILFKRNLSTREQFHFYVQNKPSKSRLTWEYFEGVFTRGKNILNFSSSRTSVNHFQAITRCSERRKHQDKTSPELSWTRKRKTKKESTMPERRLKILLNLRLIWIASSTAIGWKRRQKNVIQWY